ncbi:hypothetical protein MHYP_G00049160 [Metynnis hypsauchen]
MKARAWITEIIQDVKKIAERYEAHNKHVATTTSEIITKKKETEDQLSQFSQETKAMMKEIDTLEAELNKTTAQLTEIEKKIDAKNRELQDLLRAAAAESSTLAVLYAIVPFIGPLIKAFCEAKNASALAEKNQGVIPEPTHLKDVQECLSKIQKILLELKRFWENVNSLLGKMEKDTFAGEVLFSDPDFKEEFLESIETASKVWEGFGFSCGRAVQIFRVQSNDAYRFLEIDPSSLSQSAWQKEYDRVKERLQQLKVSNGSPLAIQE